MVRHSRRKKGKEARTKSEEKWGKGESDMEKNYGERVESVRAQQLVLPRFLIHFISSVSTRYVKTSEGEDGHKNK